MVAAIMLLMAAAVAGYAMFLYLDRTQKLQRIADEASGLLGQIFNWMWLRLRAMDLQTRM